MKKTLKVSLLVALFSVGNVNCNYQAMAKPFVKYAAIIALMLAGLYSAKDLAGLDIDTGAWK